MSPDHRSRAERLKVACVVAQALVTFALSHGALGRMIFYQGACDGSAGVAVGDRWLLSVSDEQAVVNVYEIVAGGPPRQVVDLSAALGLAPDEEADVEEAAWLGDRIYWIGSHGRNSKGKPSPERAQLVATRAVARDDGIEFQVVGKPFRGLLAALAADENLRRLGVTAVIGSLDRKEPRLAPEKEGLNIEGLTAAPDGRALFLGFRNPRPGGRALVLPLLNPTDVVDSSARPVFGEPTLLATSGMGIRAMAYVLSTHRYVLVLGAHDDAVAFGIRLWSGSPSDPLRPLLGAAIEGLTPETVVPLDGGRRILILSDDGTDECKMAAPAARKFRGLMLDISPDR